jgi:hypothetical protein
MKRLIIAMACVLVGSLGSSGAYSQAAPTEAPIAPTSTVNLNLEQQHTVREVVKDAHLPAVNVNFRITAGEPVPASVALQPMPSALADKIPQIKTHRVFVAGNYIVLVNPNDRRIALVLDDASTTGQSKR